MEGQFWIDRGMFMRVLHIIRQAPCKVNETYPHTKTETRI